MIVRASCEEPIAPNGRLHPAEVDQDLGESEQIFVGFDESPIEPRSFIVLAISVVVSFLRSTTFISHDEHRHTLTQHQRRNEILDWRSRSVSIDFLRVGPSTP